MLLDIPGMEGDDGMPADLEVIKAALDDLKKIQDYMLLAKKKMQLKHMRN